MPVRERKVVVFVHGWSVSDTRTYGGLPERLAAESSSAGLAIDVRQIFLGKYVSFRDEVRVEDLARGFEAAVRRELGGLVKRGDRFACITHSTGGPVVREWWKRHCVDLDRRCPMSHLVMLAPANFGSALSQLGKGRISRIKNWFHGVEPGSGVLDWLELGSPEARELNLDWIRHGAGRIGARGVFPFVLTGQTIDRRMYDHLVPLTAEIGSDGVVRAASANLNAGYVRLEQQAPQAVRGKRGKFAAPRLKMTETIDAPPVAFRLIPGCSHSGPSKGIQRSVRKTAGHPKGAETVQAILRCLRVKGKRDYDALRLHFERESHEVERRERVEIDDRVLLPDSHFIHDCHAMVIVRVEDERGFPIAEADLILTGGREHDPNHLPKGFLSHVQRNRRHAGTLTYFFNHDVMAGCLAATEGERTFRDALPGVGYLGLQLQPRPDTGLVHYLPCDLRASSRVLETFVRPNRTTLVDIVLRRVVREGVFRLDRGTDRRVFRRDPPGDPIE